MQRSRKFIEVGMGAGRKRGYGEKFPFMPGDLYAAVDLPFSAGAQGHDLQQRPFDDPIIIHHAKIAQLARHDIMMNLIIHPNIRDLEAFTAKRGIIFAPLYGDGRSLPIASKSVDGVLFSNVIGDPLLPDGQKDELLAEALRVLRPGCLAVMRETITPLVAEDYFLPGQWPVQRIGEDSNQWPSMQGMYDLGVRGTIFMLEAGN